MTLSAGTNITITGAISGSGDNLDLTGTAAGNTFTLSGATLTNQNIVVTGFATGSNSLLQTGYTTQTFNITSANTGNVTGFTGLSGTFTFSNIGNLTGGTNNNSFVFKCGDGERQYQWRRHGYQYVQLCGLYDGD